MNIQVYQSFLTVVQCRSFTQAAKYLNFTQPTISNHINALEEEYGVISFHQRWQKRLSDAGRKKLCADSTAADG